MGIEPTCRAVHARHNGFEDRGRHQAYKHFQNRVRHGAMRNQGAGRSGPLESGLAAQAFVEFA